MMRGFTFVPNRPFREWGDVPIRPNKHSVCAQSNQMLIGFYPQPAVKKIAPTRVCRGKGSDDILSGTKKECQYVKRICLLYGVL